MTKKSDKEACDDLYAGIARRYGLPDNDRQAFFVGMFIASTVLAMKLNKLLNADTAEIDVIAQMAHLLRGQLDSIRDEIPKTEGV